MVTDSEWMRCGAGPLKEGNQEHKQNLAGACNLHTREANVWLSCSAAVLSCCRLTPSLTDLLPASMGCRAAGRRQHR